jgi:nuclear transport factor 2 (NTF2) superfamily protein
MVESRGIYHDLWMYNDVTIYGALGPSSWEFKDNGLMEKTHVEVS